MAPVYLVIVTSVAELSYFSKYGLCQCHSSQRCGVLWVYAVKAQDKGKLISPWGC